MFRAIVVSLFLVSVFGCGSTVPVTNAQLASEVDVLKAGLEAWKNGSMPASLEAGAKPLQFVDTDWKAGAKLLEYHVVKAGAEEEGEIVCTVALKLEIHSKPVERTVSYRVVQHPKRSVTRYTPK